jgi:hypothetical protein
MQQDATQAAGVRQNGQQHLEKARITKSECVDI